jgi:hypothetical protein
MFRISKIESLFNLVNITSGSLRCCCCCLLIVEVEVAQRFNLLRGTPLPPLVFYSWGFGAKFFLLTNQLSWIFFLSLEWTPSVFYAMIFFTTKFWICEIYCCHYWYNSVCINHTSVFKQLKLQNLKQ